MKSVNATFKPRARLLVLLGDQLIRDPGVAVFELVKNAFDADSPAATVTMMQVDQPDNGQIVVEDSGIGMDLKTVLSVWLEPGTDHRLSEKNMGKRSKRFKRVPIGEKGVGRFAAHKLGNNIRLITRRAGSPEVVVEIDWERDFKKRYLDEVPLQVIEREPEHFKGSKTGTRIEISKLREQWTREMVRDLARAINAITSPLKGAGEFHTKLVVEGKEEWLEGILVVKDVTKFSLYTAKCLIKGSTLTYAYEFTPFPGMDRIKRRAVSRSILLKTASNQSIDLNEHHVGPVDMRLFIFDQDPKVLRLSEVSDKKGLKEFLNESGGIRVYRGGVRVYDYGEKGNDWLDLGGRRVNVPTKRLSNNQVIGIVSLDIKKSIDLKTGKGLIEKTNREGFVENGDFDAFRDAISCAVQQIEVERNLDKRRLRNAYTTSKLREPVVEDIADLREVIKKKKLTAEIGPYLDRIEADFVAIRDRLLTSATAGLSLSVVIHEVEKAVTELSRAVVSEKATNKIKALAKHLAQLIEGYGALVRRSGETKERASSLISQALFNVDLRLGVHKIELLPPPSKFDFHVKCSRRLAISTIMNLIDNSI